jgi:hypothetical protein
MAKEELKIGEVSRPRFEFRSFGRDFDEEAYRMSRLSVPVPEKVWERESDEIYIMSRANDINNTKIRDGKMDIKTFVAEQDGLEQWNPLMKGEFPLSTDVLRDAVFPAFRVETPALDAPSCSLEAFLEIVRGHPDLQAVKVSKRRFGYMVNGTLCEVAEVHVNGARVVSVNSESTEIADILKTLDDLGLQGVENINYLQAIKRIIGWIDKDLAN